MHRTSLFALCKNLVRSFWLWRSLLASVVLPKCLVKDENPALLCSYSFYWGALFCGEEGLCIAQAFLIYQKFGSQVRRKPLSLVYIRLVATLCHCKASSIPFLNSFFCLNGRSKPLPYIKSSVLNHDVAVYEINRQVVWNPSLTVWNQQSCMESTCALYEKASESRIRGFICVKILIILRSQLPCSHE